jgi:HNH endonuclease
VLDTIDASLARLAHRFSQRGRACVHVALRRGDAGVPGEQLQLVNGSIQPYAKDGPHDVRNGVLLRADLHRLFDQGYVTITPEYRLEVSPRLKEDYRNGRSYYPLHGASVILRAT